MGCLFHPSWWGSRTTAVPRRTAPRVEGQAVCGIGIPFGDSGFPYAVSPESQTRPGAALPRSRPLGEVGFDSVCLRLRGLRRACIRVGNAYPSNGRIPEL
jgi:hypothetical protein